MSSDTPVSVEASLTEQINQLTLDTSPSNAESSPSSASSIPMFDPTGIPTEIIPVAQRFHTYNHKIYVRGLLNKKNEIMPDGKPFNTREWTEWYVELRGPVLTFWSTADLPDSQARLQLLHDSTAVEELKSRTVPNYINITDSVVDVTDAVDGRSFVFVLNTAGANRFYLETTDPVTLLAWVRCIRLACYEVSHLHEIYTQALLSRPVFSKGASTRSSKRTEGWLQARATGSTEWKKYWTMVDASGSVPRVVFMESKRSKKPALVLTNISQAYAVYPEKPQLIDLSTIHKLEGLVTSAEDETPRPAFILLMAPAPGEMARWLCAVYDAFYLYGYPGMPEILPLPSEQELYLHPSEVADVPVDGHSLAATKQIFDRIYSEKVSGRTSNTVSSNLVSSAASPFAPRPASTAHRNSVANISHTGIFAPSSHRPGHVHTPSVPTQSGMPYPSRGPPPMMNHGPLPPMGERRSSVAMGPSPPTSRSSTYSDRGIQPRPMTNSALGGEGSVRSSVIMPSGPSVAPPTRTMSGPSPVLGTLPEIPTSGSLLPEVFETETGKTEGARRKKVTLLASDSESEDEQPNATPEQKEDEDASVSRAPPPQPTEQETELPSEAGTGLNLAFLSTDPSAPAEPSAPVSQAKTAAEKRRQRRAKSQLPVPSDSEEEEDEEEEEDSDAEGKQVPSTTAAAGQPGVTVQASNNSVAESDVSMQMQTQMQQQMPQPGFEQLTPEEQWYRAQQHRQMLMAQGGFNGSAMAPGMMNNRMTMYSQAGFGMMDDNQSVMGGGMRPVSRFGGPAMEDYTYQRMSIAQELGFDYPDIPIAPSGPFKPQQNSLLAAHDAAKQNAAQQVRNGPLVNLDSSKKTPKPTGGLVATIQAREQMKAATKYAYTGRSHMRITPEMERERALEREKERWLEQQRQSFLQEEMMRRRASNVPMGGMLGMGMQQPGMMGMSRGFSQDMSGFASRRPGMPMLPDGDDDNVSLVNITQQQQQQSFYGTAASSSSHQLPMQLPSGDGSLLGVPNTMLYARSTGSSTSVNEDVNSSRRSILDQRRLTTVNTEDISSASEDDDDEDENEESDSDSEGSVDADLRAGASGVAKLEVLNEVTPDLVDLFDQFVDEKLEMRPYSFIPAAKLYSAYKSYCRDHGATQVASEAVLDEMMIDNGFLKKRRTAAASKGRRKTSSKEIPPSGEEEWYNIALVS